MDLSIKQSVVFPPSPNPSRSPFLRKHTGLHCPLFQADADMLQCHAMQHRGEMPLITLRRLRRFGGKEEKGGWIGKGVKGAAARVCLFVPQRGQRQSQQVKLENSRRVQLLYFAIPASQWCCFTL